METSGNFENGPEHSEKRPPKFSAPIAYRNHEKTGQAEIIILSEEQERQITETPWICPDPKCIRNQQNSELDWKTQNGLFGFFLNGSSNTWQNFDDCEAIVNSDKYFIEPIDWQENDHDSWNVDLVCPCCTLFVSATLSQDTVEIYDDILNKNRNKIIQYKHEFTRNIFEQEVELMIKAIDSGDIQPIDF